MLLILRLGYAYIMAHFLMATPSMIVHYIGRDDSTEQIMSLLACQAMAWFIGASLCSDD